MKTDPNQGYYGGYPNAPPPHGTPTPGEPVARYPVGSIGGLPPYGQPGFQPSPAQQNGNDTNNPQDEETALNTLSGGYGDSSYEDTDLGKGFYFNDKTVRRGFIRKVYSILMVQLSISLAFIAWFVYHTPTSNYVFDHPELIFISIVVTFVAFITLACCGELRREAPMNFILLFLFTVAESFVLAVIASTFQAEQVVMAVGITAAVCLGLTLFSFQTKWDFTMRGGILFVALIILFIFSIVTIFVHNKVLEMVYASLGALIFSIYLIYDTQLMMGGKHKYSISPEEYIFAALNLYLDVIQLFIYILRMFAKLRK